MKNSFKWVLVAVVILATVGVAVYFGNPQTQKGSLPRLPRNVNGNIPRPLDTRPDLVVENLSAYFGDSWIDIGYNNLGTSFVCPTFGNIKIKVTFAYETQGFSESTLIFSDNQPFCNQPNAWRLLGNVQVQNERYVPNRRYQYVEVTIDPENEIAESNETNNTLRMNFSRNTYLNASRRAGQTLVNFEQN